MAVVNSELDPKPLETLETPGSATAAASGTSELDREGLGDPAATVLPESETLGRTTKRISRTSSLYIKNRVYFAHAYPFLI